MINININKDWIPFITIAVLACLLLGQCSRASSLKRDIKSLEVSVANAESNILAAKDTVDMFINKNNYLEAEIKTFSYTNEQLIVNNKEVTEKYIKALSLNRKLEGVKILLTAQLKAKDTVFLTTGIGSDNTFIFKDSVDFGDNNTRIIVLDAKINNNSTVSGNFTISQTITLLASFVDDNGVNRMMISTKYPFDNIDIQGIELINNELNIYRKKSRWNINFGLGYGIYPAGSTLRIAPFVGASIGYSPKWLQF
jgi:hypothetical protein